MKQRAIALGFDDNEAEDGDVDEREYPARPLVQKIAVRGLHGRLDYDLDLESTGDADRLALFYGDNGSGKTTVLRMVWDLLSPAPNKGHRHSISRVTFESFTLVLGNDYRISAIRKVPVNGPYEIEVRRKGRLESRSQWPEQGRFDDYFRTLSTKELTARIQDLDVELASAGREALAKRKYIETLERFTSAPYFLGDDRSTASDEVEADRTASALRRNRLGMPADADAASASNVGLATQLERSLSRVNSKLRHLTLGGTVSGSASADSVYVDVVEHLASSEPFKKDTEPVRSQLVKRLHDMGQRSRAYEALGLVPRFASQALVTNVQKVPDGQLGVLQSIMEPYLRSLTARLDALEEARALIQTLIDEANQYLNDKSVQYKRRSLKIVLGDGSELEASQLSSGECHVLLLLFTAVLARGSSQLFLIDEPELSLNVKWQRRIVRSLLSLTEGSGLQFILATHSIELLSGFRQRVVRFQSEG